MKTNKQIIISLSLILLTSLFIGNFALAKNSHNPFTQLWNTIFGLQNDVENLQTQINDLETSTETTKYLYEGTIDTTLDGDFIMHIHMTNGPFDYIQHYKKIDVPQITLDDMPTIQVYKKSTGYGLPIGSVAPEPEMEFFNQTWHQVADSNERQTLFDEGTIYIQYKQIVITQYTQESRVSILLTDYKIVVTK